MRRSICFSVIVLCLHMTYMNAQVVTDNWPHQDGNSERTAYVDTDMSPPFKYSTIDVGVSVSCFSYADGVFYIGYTEEGHNFRAFDLNTEMVLWDHKMSSGRGSIGFCPTVAEDVVFLGGQGGPGILALDRLSGDSLWLHPSASQFGRPVAVKGDLVFNFPNSQGLVCLDKDSGDLLWEFDEGSHQTVPLVDDDFVYHAYHWEDSLWALSHSGEIEWKKEIEGMYLFDATMSKGDTIFMKTRDYIMALDKFTGDELWKTILPDTFNFISGLNALTWTPHGLISHEWIGSWRDSFKIRSFDRMTGEFMWSHDLLPSAGTPATAFGDYLVNTNGGSLEVRMASTGEIVDEFPDLNLDDYSRVIVIDGHIFASSGNQIYHFTEVPSSNDNISIADQWDIINNPTSDRLWINYTGDEIREMTYQVVNFQGQLVDSGVIALGNRHNTLDVSQLPSAGYVLSLGENGTYGSKVFVKK